MSKKAPILALFLKKGKLGTVPFFTFGKKRNRPQFPLFSLLYFVERFFLQFKELGSIMRTQ